MIEDDKEVFKQELKELFLKRGFYITGNCYGSMSMYYLDEDNEVDMKDMLMELGNLLVLYGRGTQSIDTFLQRTTYTFPQNLATNG